MRLLTAILSLALLFSLVLATIVSAADIKVNVLVEPTLEYYNQVGDFSEGLAYVEKDNKWGFIDKTGKVAFWLENGYGLVQISKGFLFSNFCEGLVLVEKGNKYGFIDKTGKVVVKPEYDSAGDFSDGLAWVRNGDYRTGKYGFIDKTGKVVVKPEYDGAGDFSDGLAWVIKDGKYGFIDKTGKVIFWLEYAYVENFSDGLARVYKDGKDGFIDKTGKVVVPIEYDYAYPFSEGLAWVRKEDGKCGFIDKTGKVIYWLKDGYNRVVDPESKSGVRNFSDGLALVEKDNKYGFIDKTGKIIVKAEYDYADDFSDGLALVEKDDKWNLIDKTGKVVVKLEYDHVRDFSNGLAWVMKDWKWGIIEIAATEKSEDTPKTADTSKTAEATKTTEPAKTSDVPMSNPKKLIEGTFMGYILNDDVMAYINGNAIPSWAVDGKTVVAAEDLAKYGFSVKWNEKENKLEITRNASKKVSPIETKKNTKLPGSIYCKYIASNIRTYVDGKEVRAYNISGKTLVNIEDLAVFGSVKWDDKNREIKLIVK